MDEYWLCPRCESMVRRTANRCYSCGSTRPAQEVRPRREVVLIRDEPAPVLVPGQDDAQVLSARAALARHPYRPIGPLAQAVSAALITLLALDLVRFWTLTMLHGFDGRSSALLPNLPSSLSDLLGVVRILEPIVGITAASLWFFFLAISLVNAPALGAGTPRTTWFEAVMDWFFPLRNFTHPFESVRDLYVRLAVPGSSASKLIGAWWTACMIWYGIVYLPILLQAAEILVGIAGAIFIFIVGSGFAPQPHWTWFTSPPEMILIVILIGTIGPATILLGGDATIPAIGVPNWPHTLPGVYLIDDLQLLIGQAGFVAECAFVAAIVLWLRIVWELAQRQSVRATWLYSTPVAVLPRPANR